MHMRTHGLSPDPHLTPNPGLAPHTMPQPPYTPNPGLPPPPYTHALGERGGREQQERHVAACATRCGVQDNLVCVWGGEAMSHGGQGRESWSGMLLRVLHAVVYKTTWCVCVGGRQ